MLDRDLRGFPQGQVRMRRIVELARDIKAKTGGADIFELSENLGVKVWFRPLGGLKGFYIYENGKRYIVINEALDKMDKKVVCAHELGHDMLHRELSKGGIRENTLFLENDKTEREANIFAASVLITDEEMLDALNNSSDINDVSAQLGFPRELIGFKLAAMNLNGYNFDYGDVKSNFLK